ncbi:NAD(P)H-dependent flavin oxidoreductase [Marinobacterium jannaschii]|uniref:NAD(P)H-dependent flavin oxidoreductase n=1 Tax=Marinobacterium jannaschii TaxID=64970 RepID=UPI000485E311|nr:nitronate monooxygenase [Marinobacterium jannaschii]
MTMQQLLNIELPVIQAPMAGVQGSDLAIAVSNAGGLGSLPCAMLSPDALRAELEKIRRGTDRPFNVNFFCHTPPEPDPQADADWQALLRPYYTELAIDPSTIASGAGRTPFNAEALEVLKEFEPAVVSFHFGLPAPELLDGVRSWGAKILSSATTLEEALWLQSQGVDGVIAQGLEAGGHRGIFLTRDMTTQMGTFALTRQLVAALNLPVIAAGGIADAAGVQAAMALGAAGVQVGTAYLLCPEASTSAIHREVLASEAARHTALTNLFSGGPARGVVNRLMRELGPVNALSPAFPLATAAIAPLRAAAEAQGSGDFSPLWAGQNTRGCKPVAAAQLTRELASALD